ncbi:nuclear transport factor 2 family protein [Aeromicrobium terrae]|uniref:Nuclear transport factor 2 family protein n=1 Tax=Aeromicrobium terrae TaxID=2498846 RepID=A0A5C8NE43_9ACTN|nr:nuclear transport factor 2 family protein [Aeromicrobium terrae]TXL57762.1 nuclear transport factor 2 family protein [Aeromicrobium terrae]
MKEFRAAIEARDFDGVGALFADDVVFRSPVAFKPYEGRPIVHAIIRGVGRVFEDFRYVNEIADGADSVLVFETRIGDVTVHGADFIHANEAGLIDELTVMVRPLKAAHALADAMAAQFEQIQTEAAAAMPEGLK